YPFLFGILGTVLTAAGYFLSPPGGIPWIILTNRGEAFLAIWVAVGFCLKRRQSEERIQRQEQQIEARTQALTETHQKLYEQDRMLTAFHEVGNATRSSLDLDEVLDTLSRQVIETGIFRSLMVAIVDEHTRSVNVVRSLIRRPGESGLGFGPTNPDVTGISYDLSDRDIVAEVARKGHLEVIEGWDKRFNTEIQRPEDYRDKVSYFIPVKQGDRVLAVLATGSLQKDKAVILQRIKGMQPLLDQVAVALDHARLYAEVQERQKVLENLNQRQARDIAERRETERKLVQLERLRALGEMSAGVSHNLNNILTGILGPAQILHQISHDPKVLEQANMIRTSSIRARELVKRLHFAVRGEEETVQPVCLADIVEDAVQATRPRWKDELESRGHQIDMGVEIVGAPLIRGSQSGLFSVLINLLVNAVDALPEGGKIWVAARQNNHRVRLTVQDTGVGMDEATQRRVFEPFFTTKMDVGTGLGLSTVYGTVTRWGGDIRVESVPGEGTTFILDLPIWTEPEGKEKTDDETPVQSRSGKILVVGDEKIVGLMVARMLMYHQVDRVESGMEALERLAPGTYDVVLIDLGLADMSGDEVARKIREIDPIVGLVLITGWELREDDERLSAFDFWLQKPFAQPDYVRSTVAMAIQLRDGRPEISPER
ncbi:MAG: ATP-binding protein, partial [bacterium]|nr:ATP-binding protein [bacterium]